MKMTWLHKAVFRLFFIPADGWAKSAQQVHFDGTAIPPPIFSMYQSIDIRAGIRLGDVNILVPLAVRATAAAWRGAHGAGGEAQRGSGF